MHNRHDSTAILFIVFMVTLIYLIVYLVGTAMAEDYRVLEMKWVMVMNPHPISSSKKEFSFEDKCLIDEGGTVQYLGKDLAVYHSPGTTGGASCPDGTIFEVSLDDLEKWAYKHRIDLEAQERRRVEVCKNLGVECEK